MNKRLLTLAAIALTTVAHATPYPGNGGTGFGGPVGQGSLTFTDNGTTVTGTIAAGAGGTSTLFDELVIYIDSQTGGFTTTQAFNDTGDTLRKAISGFDGNKRATLNFAPTFTADYAIALSPIQANFGGLWALSATGAHNFLQSVSLSPTGTNGPYTFSFSLANIGSPTTSFNFSTTYLNAHSDIYRSNEAFNAITGTPADGAGNFGQNTATAQFDTYTLAPVPEPGTAASAMLAVGGLIWSQRRSFKSACNRFKRRI